MEKVISPPGGPQFPWPLPRPRPPGGIPAPGGPGGPWGGNISHQIKLFNSKAPFLCSAVNAGGSARSTLYRN